MISWCAPYDNTGSCTGNPTTGDGGDVVLGYNILSPGNLYATSTGASITSSDSSSRTSASADSFTFINQNGGQCQTYVIKTETSVGYSPTVTCHQCILVNQGTGSTAPCQCTGTVGGSTAADCQCGCT